MLISFTCIKCLKQQAGWHRGDLATNCKLYGVSHVGVDTLTAALEENLLSEPFSRSPARQPDRTWSLATHPPLLLALRFDLALKLEFSRTPQLIHVGHPARF